MTRYHDRSPSPRRRRRSPSPRRRRSRSRSRSRGHGGGGGGRSRRSRTRSRSRSRGHYRSSHRSRSRSPRRRSPPRSSQRYGSPRRRTPPRQSPPRRSSPPRHSSPPRRSSPPRHSPPTRRSSPPRHSSPPRRPVHSPPRHSAHVSSHDERASRDVPARINPPPYSRPRSRSPVRAVPPRDVSPQWERQHHVEQEKEWAPRRESPPPNYFEDVMRGLHQQSKKVPSPPPPTLSPPRRDSRASYRGRSASPPRGYDRQRDQGYRERRSPVQSRIGDRDRDHYRDRSYQSQQETRHSHDVVSSSTSSQPKPKLTLSNRFKDEHSDRPIKVEENITVEIHRKVQGTPTSRIDRSYNPDEVVIIRRKDEGIKRMFDREELRNVKYPEDDEVETRVIKVVKRETSHYREDNKFRSGPGTDVQVNRRYPSGADDGVRVELRMGRAPSPEHRRDERRRSPERSSDRRIETRDTSGDRRLIDRRVSYDGNRATNPTDLRNSLNRRREETSRDTRHVSPDSREFRRPGDSRPKIFVTGVRDRLGGRGASRTRSAPEGTTLPDFSRRPDKFRYEEWMDKPEMVPKGISYYEHDNRGEQGTDYWARRGRGRGRGRVFRPGFRGRGRGRGSYTSSSSSSGGYSSYRERSSEGGKWKHDKFREDEERAERGEVVEDNKPSSTTESK